MITVCSSGAQVLVWSKTPCRGSLCEECVHCAWNALLSNAMQCVICTLCCTAYIATTCGHIKSPVMCHSWHRISPQIQLKHYYFHVFSPCIVCKWKRSLPQSWSKKGSMECGSTIRETLQKSGKNWQISPTVISIEMLPHALQCNARESRSLTLLKNL